MVTSASCCCNLIYAVESYKFCTFYTFFKTLWGNYRQVKL